jgi:hypothetical protein
MTASREQRIEILTRAAKAKHETAVRRAERGLCQLIKQNEPVTFRSVARAGGVSLDFLYRHDELRARIQQLRAQQQRHPVAAGPQPCVTGTASNVVTSLTAKLRDARQEVADLKAQLAVAHGELLALRRQLPGAATDR